MDGPPTSEVRESFYLLGFMAALLTAWLGLGLFAARMLG